MSMTSDPPPQSDRAQSMLARLRAFATLHQRAVMFLAAEAAAFGQDFEQSTEGATQLLSDMLAQGEDGEKRRAIATATAAVVYRLQTADRSRQGLEQIATVLSALHRQQAALIAALESASPPPTERMVETWVAALAENVTLADWRHRLEDALRGLPQRPGPAHGPDPDEELF
jgi:hypothetical protein